MLSSAARCLMAWTRVVTGGAFGVVNTGWAAKSNGMPMMSAYSTSNWPSAFSP